MKKLNCLIIDDEPIAREGINDYCNEISFLNVIALCKNALQANDYINSNTIDLVFLDINMPLINGLEWLKTLKKSPLVILTTAYSEHALESFNYDVVDYLVKPIPFNRFLKAVNKAYRLTNKVENETSEIFIKTSKSLKKVTINSILFIESLQNYIRIKTDNEEIITHSTLKDMKDNLPSYFIQTHKSFIVSKFKIDEIIGNKIRIKQHEIPISIRMKKEVLAKITS